MPQTAEERLRNSPKFLHWRPERILLKQADVDVLVNDLAHKERHYSPTEIAKQWGVSIQTVRTIFGNEEGVLKIGSNGTRHRRRYKTLRIPESVAIRVHTRLSA